MTSPICPCGRGPAWWTLLGEARCLHCALSAYRKLATSFHVQEWLTIAEHVGELNADEDIPSTELLWFADELIGICAGR